MVAILTIRHRHFVETARPSLQAANVFFDTGFLGPLMALTFLRRPIWVLQDIGE